MSFEKAFAKTLVFEGTFNHDPDDSGNWTGGAVGKGELHGTKFGISAASYPNEDIQNLTINRAMDLYRRDYWMPLNLDAVISTKIQEEVFDTAVNMGGEAAAEILQAAINFLQPANEQLEVDHIIGPKTLAVVNKWCQKDAYALFKVLNGFQFMLYFRIIMDDAMKRKFAAGWMRRIQDYVE